MLRWNGKRELPRRSLKRSPGAAWVGPQISDGGRNLCAAWAEQRASSSSEFLSRSMPPPPLPLSRSSVLHRRRRQLDQMRGRARFLLLAQLHLSFRSSLASIRSLRLAGSISNEIGLPLSITWLDLADNQLIGPNVIWRYFLCYLHSTPAVSVWKISSIVM